METAYVLVQCKIAHEMEVLKALLEIDLVNTTVTASVDNAVVGNDSGQVSQTTTSSVSSTSGY